LLLEIGGRAAVDGGEAGSPATRQGLAEVTHHVRVALRVGAVIEDRVSEEDQV
jgi:hypothetical protein